MNGWPDAVFVKDFSSDTLDTWPMTVTVGRNELVYGHLRQGPNWFYAWMDGGGAAAAAGSGGNAAAGTSSWLSWNDGEPAAVADNQFDGIEIGFDLNEVTFHLTDKPESFARVSWQDKAEVPEDHEGYHVLINGAEDFLYHVQWPRTWVHEWDIVNFNLSQGNPHGLKGFGLGARDNTLSPDNNAPVPLPVSVVPESVYRSTTSSANFVDLDPVNNWIHTVTESDSDIELPPPVLYAPIGKEIVADARPEFKFRLDPEFTEFQFVFKRVNLASGESVAIFDQRILAPGRFWNEATGRRDLVIWRFPHSVGDRIVNGRNSYLFAEGPGFEYRWTVVPYSPGIRTAQEVLTPTEGVFLTAATSAVAGAVNVSGGKGAITVNVAYPSGMVTLDPATTYMEAPFIRVQAFRSKSFNGLPDASIQAKAVGTYTLSGLEDGASYYIRAYIEQDGDHERDKWESWGYYRAGNGAVNPFVPVAVKATSLGNASSPCAVVIQDCDTDNDLLPDSYEWAEKSNLSEIGVAYYAPEVKKNKAYSLSPLHVAAAANPGAGYALLANGIGTKEDGDDDADGFSNGLEDALGLDLNAPQTLKITSVSIGADGGPVLDWKIDGVERKRDGNDLGREVVYEVQAKVNLTDKEWTTIRKVYSQSAVIEGANLAEEPEKGVDVSTYRFFRVKLGTSTEK